MKNLFKSINVSTNENDAMGSYASITHEEWNDCETCEAIVTGLESCGVTEDEYFDNWMEGLDVIENALNNSCEGETVYFWVD